MKKLSAWILLLCMLVFLVACSQPMPNKSDVITLYRQNEKTFLQAAESGDYSEVELIDGVTSVYCSAKYIDIKCGGAGLGSNTYYTGIFYSADDNLCAIDVAGPEDKLIEQDSGYLYQEENGDNRYYVEPLGNHFFYYEAHF